jgi:putative phosphoribosyl transferase
MNTFVENSTRRDKRYVFEDRCDAGKLLAGNLTQYKGEGALILAIPAGGLPAAAEIAKAPSLQLDSIIVRKLQLPFNPEAGFGAMGPEGEVMVNEELLSRLMLTEETVHAQIKQAAGVIRKREHLFREGRPFPSCMNRSIIVVDDGLASGYTMLAALQYIKKEDAFPAYCGCPDGARADDQKNPDRNR